MLILKIVDVAICKREAKTLGGLLSKSSVGAPEVGTAFGRVDEGRALLIRWKSKGGGGPGTPCTPFPTVAAFSKKRGNTLKTTGGSGTRASDIMGLGANCGKSKLGLSVI